MGAVLEGSTRNTRLSTHCKSVTPLQQLCLLLRFASLCGPGDFRGCVYVHCGEESDGWCRFCFCPRARVEWLRALKNKREGADLLHAFVEDRFLGKVRRMVVTHVQTARIFATNCDTILGVVTRAPQEPRRLVGPPGLTLSSPPNRGGLSPSLHIRKKSCSP